MVEIIKKILITLSIAALLLIALLYFLIIIFVPKLFNSEEFKIKMQNELNKKTGLKLEIINHSYKLRKSLYSSAEAEKISLKNQNHETILIVNNLRADYKPFDSGASFIKADSLFFDKTKLDINKKTDKSISLENFNHKKLPNIDIKNINIIFSAKDPMEINIANFKGNLEKENYLLNFSSNIKTKYINCPLEANNVTIEVSKDKFNFKNFGLIFDNKPIKIEGFYDFKNNYDLKITAKELSVNLIEKTFLYFMKQKEPDNKNFIENFYDFKGFADINLIAKNGEITGSINLKDFGAKYVKFSIPLYFKNARFNFDKDKITLKEFGTLGEQKAYTEFLADKLFTKDKIIKGTLTTTANNDFAKKYIEGLEIIGDIDLSLNYTVFNKEITVNYLANLDKKEGVIYNDAYLETRDDKRRLYAKTFKQGNTMYLKEYDYSKIENNKIKNIFIGDGQFDRYNNKYHLNYISCKTAELTPVNIFGFFNKLIEGGYFEGDVKYFAKNKVITGNFNLFNSKYKNFIVQNAKVKADSKNIIINSLGTFENEPYKAFLNVNNTLYDKITVNDLNLYLKQYVIKRNSSKTKKPANHSEKIVNKVKEADITIKKGNIKLDKLIFKKIVLENMELEGTVENNIAYFDMPDIFFAEGKLSAKGVYDLETKSSNIDFSAKDIDSNLASGMIFNLQNQFEGLANASLYFRSFNNLDIIDAKADFSIIDGALTKLGSKEFLVKKSKDSKKTYKFKLTDILNVNEKQIKAIRSNLNGNFILYNNQIDNLEIFTKQKYVSLYLNGNYNIKSQYADVDIFGKYNKNAQKGIKVLFIPLSWVTKAIFKNSETKHIYSEELSKIPSVEGIETDKELFVVKVKGNPNDNSNIKVEMKSLK